MTPEALLRLAEQLREVADYVGWRRGRVAAEAIRHTAHLLDLQAEDEVSAEAEEALA